MSVSPRSTAPRGRTLGTLSRQRVDSLVDQLWNHRLTLVIAPAGSGKTTALRHFAARAAPVAWCAADALDMSPDGCLAELARAVGGVIGVERDGSSPALLSRGLADWSGERVAVVIDDLHLIASTLAESELGNLLDHQPEKLVIAASTRSYPEFDVSRLRLDDELLEITSDDLRFRTWEADRLFRDHYHMILGPADVAMLITRTEGWAAGLQLYNLAARDQPLDARRRLMGELSATRVGRDYLARNVLAGLPNDLQSFLLATAALPVLTAALCDEVTGRSDSAAVLQRLEHNQLFTIEVDRRGTYRYHEVLRAHLDATLLQRLGTAGVAEHHGRVGRLLEADGKIDDALRAFCRAGDWAAVSRLVVQQGSEPMSSGVAVGDAWIELVPGPIVENDTVLLLTRARQRALNGRLGAAMRDYERACLGATTEAVANTCEEERSRLAVWTDPSAPAPAGWLGAVRSAAQGLSTAGQPHVDPAVDEDARAMLGRGLMMLIADQPAAAGEVLSEVLRHGVVDNRVSAIAEFARALAEGLIAVQTDGPPLEPARMEKVVSVADRCGLGWLARIARAALALTSQAGGCESARDVRDECERDGDAWGAALAAMFEGIGHMLRAAHAFTAVGAHAMVDLLERVGHSRPGMSSDQQPQPTEPSMSVRCFGALELVVDGTTIDLAQVRPRALSVLRVLAMHIGRPVHREVLMEALWREVDPDAARRSLQVAVSSLRALMPGRKVAGITRHGDTYQLELSSDGFSDVRSFQSLLSAGVAARAAGEDRRALDALLRCVDLYRGDLLLDEGPAEWLIDQRNALRLDMVRACAIAGEVAIKLGQPHVATTVAERGLAVDRYADALWRLLIDSFEHVSDSASAERVRRSHRAMMADLGIT
jgi:DNA-binding SARP family transcriptional activator